MIGAVFFNSLYLHEILGYSPIQAGLAWLPQTVLIMVVSNIGARIATKLGARTLIALGTLVLGAGMLLFLRTAPESDYVTVPLPAMLVLPRPIQPLSAAAQSQLLLARCGPFTCA